MAAISLGVRCEYGSPAFPTYRKLPSAPQQLPFLSRGRSYYHHILSFCLVLDRSVLEHCAFLN